jgi:broad specificity phosphatase PhoE
MEHPTKLYLVRHGEVEEKYHRIYGGRIDMDLSELGRRQAEALGDFFRSRKPDAIYCSSMKRALQTLEPIRNGWSIEPTILDDLREIDFGAWTGLEWDEVARRHEAEVFDWLTLLDSGEVEGAESTVELRARLEPCLDRIVEAHKGQSVAIVCHGAVIRSLLSILLDMPLARLGAVDVSYASVTLVDWSPKLAVARYINHTPWESSS